MVEAVIAMVLKKAQVHHLALLHVHIQAVPLMQQALLAVIHVDVKSTVHQIILEGEQVHQGMEAVIV